MRKVPESNTASRLDRGRWKDGGHRSLLLPPGLEKPASSRQGAEATVPQSFLTTFLLPSAVTCFSLSPVLSHLHISFLALHPFLPSGSTLALLGVNKNKSFVGLEQCLRCPEPVLLLHRTGVQFPAPPPHPRAAHTVFGVIRSGRSEASFLTLRAQSHTQSATNIYN